MPELSEISKRRRQLGLTQNQLAKLSGVSQSAIAKIESNKLMPSYETVKKLFVAIDSYALKQDKKAADVMNRKVERVFGDWPVKRAVTILKKKGFSQLPVMDRDGRMIGAVTEKRIIECGGSVYEHKCIDIMEEPFPTVSANTPVTLVRELLKKNSAIVVVGKNSRIKGIITKTDVL